MFEITGVISMTKIDDGQKEGNAWLNLFMKMSKAYKANYLGKRKLQDYQISGGVCFSKSSPPWTTKGHHRKVGAATHWVVGFINTPAGVLLWNFS